MVADRYGSSAPGAVFFEDESLLVADVGIGTRSIRCQFLRRSEELRSTPTVLVVDDDDAVRDLAADILEGFGYIVVSAHSGEEALALLQEHDGIALLFTDVVMPGMSGIELAKRAMALKPDLPVIFISGYTAALLYREWDLGRLHFIAKPYRPRQLEELAASVLPPIEE